MKLDCLLPHKAELKQKNNLMSTLIPLPGKKILQRNVGKRRQDTRLRTYILNRHWRTGDRRWKRTALRSPLLTRNIGELPVSRSSFPLLLDDSDEITVCILWLELLFSTGCAKGRLDQVERGSVRIGGAVGRQQCMRKCL
jgi:hypothetical protein